MRNHAAPLRGLRRLHRSPACRESACRRARCRMVSTTRRCRESRASSTCRRRYSCSRRKTRRTRRAVRIFTPARELPFAGHPTVGTAICLAGGRFPGPGEHDAVIVLEEKVGPVRCGVKVSDSTGFAEFDCPKLPERAGDAAAKELIAAAVSLAPTDVGFENHVPSVWSAGVPYHYVPVRGLAALAKFAAEPQRLGERLRPRRRFPLYARDRGARSCLPRPHVRARARNR